MKKIILTLIGVLFCAPLFAEMNPYISGARPNVVTESPSCSTSTDSVQFAFDTVSGGETTATASGNTIRGVEFTTSSAITITGVSVRCSDTSSDTGSITMYLRAYGTVFNAPTGDVLASVSVSSSALPNSAAEHFFELSTPYEAAAGDYCFYWVASDGGSITLVREDNVVSNMFNFISIDGGTNWAADTKDMTGEGVYGCN